MLEWKERYSCNIDEIDRHHKKLFAIGENLYYLLGSSDAYDNYDEAVSILQELISYTQFCLQHEEQLLESYNFSKLNDHKQQHKNFIQNLHRFLDPDYAELLDQAQGTLAFTLFIIVVDWLEQHILRSDYQYRDILHSTNV